MIFGLVESVEQLRAKNEVLTAKVDELRREVDQQAGQVMVLMQFVRSALDDRVEKRAAAATHAVLTDYDASGAPSVRIHADRIDQVDHGPEVALSNVRVDYQSPNGQSWVMLGDTGHLESGGKIVDVAGNVKLTEVSTDQAAPAVMHTDTLRYDVANGIASTQSDVRIDFGPHALTARGLIANLKDRTMRLESKVNGRFQP